VLRAWELYQPDKLKELERQLKELPSGDGTAHRNPRP